MILGNEYLLLLYLLILNTKIVSVSMVYTVLPLGFD